HSTGRGGGNADARVRYLERERLGLDGGAQRDCATRRREFRGVAKQVEEDLADAQRIDIARETRGNVRVEVERARSRLAKGGMTYGREQRVNVDRLAMQLDAPCLDLRKIEDV